MIRTKLRANFLYILGSLICFSLVVSSCVTSVDYGLRAARNGDFDAAFKTIKPLAEEGNGEAQFWMGVMAENGHAVPKNAAEAVKWYKLSAEQGYMRGQNRLGVLYLRGQDVTQDSKKGVELIRLSAGQGFAVALWRLSKIYSRSEHVIKNNIYAFAWNQLATLAAYSDGRRGMVKELKERKEKLIKDMSSIQIEEAEALAKQCLESKYKDCD